jgi:hypothetical protein
MSYWLMVLPWVIFILLLAFGPAIVDYRACSSFPDFTYDWVPYPHCNFHFDTLSGRAALATKENSNAR